MRCFIRTTVHIALAGFGLGGSAFAQETAPRCRQDEVQVPSLGISSISCSNCTMFSWPDPQARRWEFNAEPVILAVKPDGPAAGKLRTGDVIVAVDGDLVTTRDGGRRIARPERGQATDLRIRRDGREITVAVSPWTDCEALPESSRSSVPVIVNPGVDAPVGTRNQRRPPVDSVHVTGETVAVFPSPTEPALPQLMPEGWLGLSIQCSQCELQVVSGSRRSWTFPEPPVIVAVEDGSPAARVGLRSGDRIVSVDGLAITSEAGGSRFGGIAPGERITIGSERDGRLTTATLTAGSRVRASAPRPSRSDASANAIVAGTVRYTGRFGDTLIEVTGEPVTVVETESEIIIRSSSTTVRLRKTGSRIQ